MISNETIWITGASSGIGLQLAKRLDAMGNRLILSARNEQALAELCSQFHDADYVVFDVSEHSMVTQVRAQLSELCTHLDRVILNAGDCEYFEVEEKNWAAMQRMMQVNFLGVVNSIEVSFDLLNKAEQPHVIGISSQAYRTPFPKAEAYGASKAAVGYFLSTLQMDFPKLTVSEILPGFVDTPLTRKNTFSMPFLMDVDTATERMLRAIARRDRRYAFPKRLSAILMLAKCMPRLWQKVLGASN